MTRAALLALFALAQAVHAQGDPTVQRLFGSGITQSEHFGWSVDVEAGPLYTLAVVGADQDRAPLGQGAAFVYRYDESTGLFAEEVRLQAVPGSGYQGRSVAVLPGPDDEPDRALVAVGSWGQGWLWRRAAGGAWAVERTFGTLGDIGLARTAVGDEYAAVGYADSVWVVRRAAGSPMESSSWVHDAWLVSEPEGLAGAVLAVWAAPDGSVGVAVADRGQGPREVVVFRRDPDTGAWAEEARLSAPGTGPSDYFGVDLDAAVGLDGVERVVVGAEYRPNTFPQPPGGAA